MKITARTRTLSIFRFQCDCIYAKIMWTCEHETNDHSISVSLILTLPLNKRTTNGALMRSSETANRTKCTKYKKNMSCSKQMLDTVSFENRKFRSAKILWLCICVVCMCTPNATKINKYGLAHQRRAKSFGKIRTGAKKDVECRTACQYCV